MPPVASLVAPHLLGQAEEVIVGPLSSLTPGTNSTIKCPSTGKYHALGIRMNVATVASITHGGAADWATYIDSVQVRIGASAEIDVTPSIMSALNIGYVWGNPSNVFLIPLSWPNMRLGAGEDLSGYGTSDVDSMDVIVKLAAGAYTVDKLELFALRSELNEPLGQHLTIRRYPKVVSGAGDYEINDIFRVGETIYAFALDTNDFDHVLFKAGNTIVRETYLEPALAFGGLVGRADTGFLIDLLRRDRLDEAHLVDTSDHRLTLTFGGAHNTDIAVVSVTPR